MRSDTRAVFTTRHPRREADPQSHGTPPEFAGLPKRSERRRGCSPIREDLRVQPHSQARRPRRRRSRSGLSRSPPSRLAAQAARPSTSAPPSRSSVLGGSTVTNTGPSVLNGDLGVSPGTSLVGFGAPAVVNGATHNNDARRHAGQSDLTTAYDVDAGQPARHRPRRARPRRPDLHAGAYRYAPLGAAHRRAHARRAKAIPPRAVRLQDRLDADHGLRQRGAADQRRLSLQRVLAGRQLGDARHHHRVPGQRHGADRRSPLNNGARSSGGCSPATARSR